jgi:hypothetical protein
MWTSRSEDLPDRRGRRLVIEVGSRPATVAEVLQAWQDDEVFGSFFNALLADSPFSAFRWETPAASVESASRPFECVLLDDPNLARPSDPNSFSEQFRLSTDEVVSFANLGGDATLVVPRPIADPSAYGHLAAFVRLAPQRQRLALWRAVGEVMQNRLSKKPVWLSTAGAGVPWLHVRIDDRPKYYGHWPYRQSS